MFILWEKHNWIHPEFQKRIFFCATTKHYKFRSIDTFKHREFDSTSNAQERDKLMLQLLKYYCSLLAKKMMIVCDKRKFVERFCCFYISFQLWKWINQKGKIIWNSCVYVSSVKTLLIASFSIVHFHRKMALIQRHWNNPVAMKPIIALFFIC